MTWPLLSEALNTKSLLLPASRQSEQHALLREALRIAEEHDLTEQLIRAINNLIVHAEQSDRPAEAAVLLRQAIDIARARGHRAYLTWFGAGLVNEHFEDGDWDEAFALAGETLPEGTMHTGNAIAAAVTAAMASFERADDEGARAWLARIPPDLGRLDRFTECDRGPLRRCSSGVPRPTRRGRGERARARRAHVRLERRNG